MKLVLFLTLSVFALCSTANDVDNSIFRDYAANYLAAIRSENKEEILKLTSSENIDIHIANIRVLEEVGGASYVLDVSPYDKDKNDFGALIMNMSSGKCTFPIHPTHKLNITWRFTVEEYSKGHACHRLANKNSTITLFVHVEGNQVKEVSSCSNEYRISSSKEVNIGEIKISNDAKAEIKEWLKIQESFSRVGSLKHVKTNYSLNFREANSVVNTLCADL